MGRDPFPTLPLRLGMPRPNSQRRWANSRCFCGPAAARRMANSRRPLLPLYCIVHWRLGLALGIGAGNWHWGLALGIGAGNWRWELALGIGARNWRWELALRIPSAWRLEFGGDVFQALRGPNSKRPSRPRDKSRHRRKPFQ